MTAPEALTDCNAQVKIKRGRKEGRKEGKRETIKRVVFKAKESSNRAASLLSM
jgi:hypothetical protein